MARPLRVAIRYWDAAGMSGIKRYTFELAAGLQRLGVAARLSRHLHHEVTVAGRRVGGLLTMRLGFWLPPLGADVVHATHYTSVPRVGRCHAVTVHDVIPSAHPDLFGLDAKGKKGHDDALRRALGRSWILTVSEATRQEILRLFPAADAERIVPVHLGIDHDRFRPADAPAPQQADRLTVAVCMNPEWRKRVDLLLRAALRLPFVHVLHAGGDRAFPGHAGALARNQEAARALAAQGRYTALGALGDKALADLFRRADVVVHPSMAEGFSLPPLEALACGARVLASDIPPHREVLGDAASYFPLSEDGIVDALQRAWDGGKFPPLAHRLERAREFTWDRTAEKTLAVYRRTLE